MILQMFPGIAHIARLQRRYLGRAVRYLAGDALPPGSYLALSDGTDTSPALNHAIAAYNQNSASSYHLRSPGRRHRRVGRHAPGPFGIKRRRGAGRPRPG